MAFIYVGLGTLGTFACPTVSIGLQSKQLTFIARMRSGQGIGGHTLAVGRPGASRFPWVGPQSISWGSGAWKFADGHRAKRPQQLDSINFIHGLTVLRRRVLGSLEPYRGNRSSVLHRKACSKNQ
jgi:hypothetical protein